MAHDMQEFRELVFVLEYINQNFECITELEFGNTSRFINEFWRQYWNMRKTAAINERLNIRKYGKMVAVFGTGLF